jgi:predicted GNAT family N-acyltransferase
MGRGTVARAVEPTTAVNVRDADFAADFASIRFVRTAVFIDEQRVPLELEFDDRDALCRHVLALEGERPIGTGRIDVGYGGKIGRVAVLESARRNGVGNAIMARLHEIAREQGLTRLWCHAQLTAVPFYEHLGYRSLGPVFDEAGIDHVRMECDLP